jgi:hypothetical protein
MVTFMDRTKCHEVTAPPPWKWPPTNNGDESDCNSNDKRMWALRRPSTIGRGMATMWGRGLEWQHLVTTMTGDTKGCFSKIVNWCTILIKMWTMMCIDELFCHCHCPSSSIMLILLLNHIDDYLLKGNKSHVWNCSHMNRTKARSFYLNKEKLNPRDWQTGLSDFVNFDGSQRRHRHSSIKLLHQPSDVWIEDRLEPQQPKGLWQWLLDLIARKWKQKKTRAKLWEKLNCIDSIVVLHQSVVTYVYIGSRT